MRFLIICFFIFFGAFNMDAQKYVLLDKEMSQPAFYANELSTIEKYKGFFPVEAKNLNKFIAVLQEISQTLLTKSFTGEAKQYHVGCDKFKGMVVYLASGNRLDYVISSNCDKMNVTMHISDAKLNNENNAYFINTWISYIKNSSLQKR